MIYLPKIWFKDVIYLFQKTCRKRRIFAKLREQAPFMKARLEPKQGYKHKYKLYEGPCFLVLALEKACPEAVSTHLLA